jgi:hypothetical protein
MPPGAGPGGMTSGDGGHHAGADGAAAFAHGEAHAGFDGEGAQQLEANGGSLTGGPANGSRAASQHVAYGALSHLVHGLHDRGEQVVELVGLLIVVLERGRSHLPLVTDVLPHRLDLLERVR